MSDLASEVYQSYCDACKVAEESSQIGRDVLYVRLNSCSGMRIGELPLRINGWLMILCHKGSISFDIDFKICEVNSHELCCVGLESLLRIRTDLSKDFDVSLLFLSPDYMRNLNLDMSMINLGAVARARHSGARAFQVSDTDFESLDNIIKIIHLNSNSDDTVKLDNHKHFMIRSLVLAMIYDIMSIEAKGTNTEDVEDSRKLPRRAAYVHRFMLLVQEYHNQERSVAFYADKLYISPKYLSLIVKEATGRSAVQWIDDMVILEAKNLLRFSGKNIQQVAYALNFANQSAFGKYFKHITGKSPSQYLKS